MNSTQANRLISERSPYLQQHAYNPVDWYPWGEEAFTRACEEDKPIFLSIGYSTCHWCHVMERESFEDTETAELMNQFYINIKVDREERPDVDAIYMAAAQALTGQGGWPLSAWLTPDLKPYYLGTYFPPRSMYGRPSFREALSQLRSAWDNERERVEKSSRAILQAVQRGAEITDHDLPSISRTAESNRYSKLADLCFERLSNSFDEIHGGFGSAPKFPRPAVLEFLLYYYYHTDHIEAKEMTLKTLSAMASGGMYDQLGGGFARYSVDAEWKVPHFEKMLYDQGQLLALYADAYRLTGNESYAKTIHQTVDYLRRDLQGEKGGFFAAEDADSEGEEGKFYVWTISELEEVLNVDELQAITLRYGITDSGNFEDGKNVLHTTMTLEHVAEEMETPKSRIEELLAQAISALFTVREQRVRPARDEKILTAWNGLTISGLAKAGAALSDNSILDDAEQAARMIQEHLIVDHKLMRRSAEDEVRFLAYLDDYAFLIQGLIDLYEGTFNVEWLQEADRLTQQAIELFWDERGGGFFMTAEGIDPHLLLRAKSDHDGAEPSGNSVMALNLLRLTNLFDDEQYRNYAERTTHLFAHRVAAYPDIMPLIIAAGLLLEKPSGTIVIASSDSDRDGAKRLIEQTQRRFRPYTSVVVTSLMKEHQWLNQRAPFISKMKPVEGESVAYVCRDFVCNAPTTSLQ